MALNPPATSVDEQSDKPTSVADTLRRARALIEDPKHWTQGAYARIGRTLLAVTSRDPEATVFCMIGAIRRVGGPYEPAAVWRLTSVVGSITAFNDVRWRTHAQVLAKFDEAIAKAEGRQP